MNKQKKKSIEPATQSSKSERGRERERKM